MIKTFTAILALAPLSLTGLASTSSDVHSSSQPTTKEAEVREIIYGEDVAIVFPETNAPDPGTSDIVHLGDIDEDTHIVFADSEGNIPGGLTLDEAKSLEAQGAVSKKTVLEDAPDFGNEYAPLVGQCQDLVAGPVGTGPASNSSTLAVIGTDTFTRIGYTYQLAAGTNQAAAVSGIGYHRVQSGGEISYERAWYPFGLASADTVGTGDASWGNVSAYPEFQAESTTIHLAQVRWCH